jgi:hypothetical protein
MSDLRVVSVSLTPWQACKPPQENGLSILPPDCFAEILKHLKNPNDVKSLACTSSTIFRRIDTETSWYHRHVYDDKKNITSSHHYHYYDSDYDDSDYDEDKYWDVSGECDCIDPTRCKNCMQNAFEEVYC